MGGTIERADLGHGRGWLTPNAAPVPGYEGRYEVTSAGEVRSLLTGRTLRPAATHTGHQQVALHRDGASRTWLVHHLVALAFLGPRPAGQEVRHMNGDPSDNRITNLRYGTRSENVLDQVRHGVHNNASKTHCKNGHAFTPENTMRRGAHGRRCRTCNAASQRKYQEARHALA